VRRRRLLTVGAVALACVVGGVLSVVVAERGSPDTGRSRSSSQTLSGGGHSATTLAPAGSSTPARQDTPARPSTGFSPTTANSGAALPTCPRPASSVESGGWSLVATTKGTIPRFAAPGGAADGTIAATWYGGVSALAVIAERPGWYEVRLATRPDGSTGWVRSSDVTVTTTPYWISVDLATRHVKLFRLSQPILDAPAGVGTASDPTPTGQYFVAFFESSPSAGYGPFILVTSAHSNAITDWEGSGDAVIGIHGPLGTESLIGTTGAYLSHGCIRIPIPDLVQLRDVPAGSPITICA
jgi:hypothetical protein